MKSKRLKVSKNACPLENHSIDIVPENNHLVGLCLCQFCKCGKHICTKNRHLNAKYLSDSFHTSYARDYKPRNFDVPYHIHPHPYKPNTQKMDFITTNSLQYKSPTPIDKKFEQGSSYSKAKVALIGTTSNSYYYPNWGKNEVKFEKGWHAPVRSVEIPFRGETSYSRQFIKPDLEKSKNADPRKFSACQSRISISPKDSFNPRTTYNEKMNDYSRSDLNTHVKVATPKARMTKAIPNHFRTSSDTFYSGSKASNIDPRSLRLTLLSRSSIG